MMESVAYIPTETNKNSNDIAITALSTTTINHINCNNNSVLRKRKVNIYGYIT